MAGSTYERGQQGEEVALAILKTKGYEIWHRNFRSGGPEVDIIARVGDTLCFVEVKSWQTCAPLEFGRALNHRKRQRIIRAARLYLAKHPECATMTVRFDCMLAGADGTWEHLEAAFDASN